VQMYQLFLHWQNLFSIKNGQKSIFF